MTAVIVGATLGMFCMRTNQKRISTRGDEPWLKDVGEPSTARCAVSS